MVELSHSKARTACLILRIVWSSGETGNSVKLRTFDTNVKSILLYGSERCKLTQTTLNELQFFTGSCLFKILSIGQLE